MYQLISKLIIYRNLEKDSILLKIADIDRQVQSNRYNREVITNQIYEQIHRLLDIATTYGFDQNLWHRYIAFLLAMTENPFTLVSEKEGILEGTVHEFAKQDFDVFYQLFHYDFRELEKRLNINCFSLISHYHAIEKKEQFYNKNVSLRIQELSQAMEKAKDSNEMYLVTMQFYKQYGVGKFGMNKAFRIPTERKEGLLIPIIATSPVRLDDLIGYEIQKQQLVQNTEAFLAGQPANNVLLYGDAGTGKSTSIKALLNHYYNRGLRMIEIYKHDFQYLPEIISIIKSRNYRFIIFMDDLSFESCETEYKYLKAVIEGGLETKPDNVLIYATSNRCHLIRESFNDRKEIDSDDVHRSDTMAERLSLAARFGLSISYYKPKRQEFHHIVLALAHKHKELCLSDEELLAEADKWELRHGGLSGRVAQQFIDYLVGTTDKPWS